MKVHTQMTYFTAEVHQAFNKELILVLLKILKKRTGGNTSKLILKDQHYPDTKTGQGQGKKMKRYP